MPEWKKNYEPMSFMEIVKENLIIKAHSLILIDIGLELEKSFEQLELSSKKYGVKLNKLVICSQLGTKDSKIYYNTIEEIKSKKIQKPYCIIIPSELHFVEKEMLEGN